MGTRLIFLGQEMVTDCSNRASLIGLGRIRDSPWKQPSIGPYPKPTQVDR